MIPVLAADGPWRGLAECTLSPGFASLMFTMAGCVLLWGFYRALFGVTGTARHPRRRRGRRTAQKDGALHTAPGGGREGVADEDAWDRIMWATDLAVSKEPVRARLGHTLLEEMARDGRIGGSARSFLDQLHGSDASGPLKPAE